MKNNDIKIIRTADVAAMIGVSLPTLWRMRKSGDFPEPNTIPGTRSVGWRAEVIDEWITKNFNRGVK